jgi:hypothetical protein
MSTESLCVFVIAIRKQLRKETELSGDKKAFLLPIGAKVSMMQFCN